MSGEFSAQYRFARAPAQALFREVVTDSQVSTFHPSLFSTSIGADAYICPFHTLLDPETVQAAANTSIGMPGNVTYLTGTIRRNDEDDNPVDFGFQIPTIFTPLIEAAAAFLGVPPGVATMAIAGVNALINIGEWSMPQFENKVRDIQDANDQAQSGVIGGATTGSGIVTSVRYEPNLRTRTPGITQAAGLVQQNLADTWTDMYKLWTAAKSVGFAPLCFTWPQGTNVDVSPLTILQTLFETADQSYATLKTVPTPVDNGTGPLYTSVTEYSAGSPLSDVDFLPYESAPSASRNVCVGNQFGSPLPQVMPTPLGRSFYVIVTGDLNDFSRRSRKRAPRTHFAIPDQRVTFLDRLTNNTFTRHIDTSASDVQRFLSIPAFEVSTGGSLEFYTSGLASYRLLGDGTISGDNVTLSSGPDAVTFSMWQPSPFGLCTFLLGWEADGTPSYASFGSEKLLRNSATGNFIDFVIDNDLHAIYEIRFKF